MKMCKICKITKDLSGFYKNISSDDGHRSRCKECDDAERKRRKQVNYGESKLCNGCGKVLPRKAFGLNPRTSSGLRSRCFKCDAAKQSAWRRENREVVRVRERQYYRKRRSDPERRRRDNELQKLRTARMPPEKRRRMQWQNHLTTSYKLTIAEYEAMVTRQNGHCACCGRKKARLTIDHDHATGRVRGLLCHLCNTSIGGLGDSVAGIQKAIDYLNRFCRK